MSFGSIEVRSYEIILGDNPGVSDGPPLTIDWDHFESVPACPVDMYEEKKNMTPTRDLNDMRMSPGYRFDLLARTCSMEEITKRIKEGTKARRQRSETQSKSYRSGRDEKMELFRRRVRNIFTKENRKEKAYLANAMQVPLPRTLKHFFTSCITMVL